MNLQRFSKIMTPLKTLGIVFLMFFAMAFACNDGGDTPIDKGDSTPINRGGNNPQGGECTTQKGVGKKYGTRDPRICTDTKAPASGAITAALAKKYFEGREGESSDLLYLFEDINVEVGGGIPYSAIRGQRSFEEVDVNQPVYPIRGSYTKYVCNRVYEEDAESKCTDEKIKAQGYCYKTTFGDWKCYY